MPADETHKDKLPDALVAALKAQQRAQPLITSRVDREIARLGDEHFRSRAESRRRRTPIWIAAASVLVAVVLVQTQFRSGDAPPGVLVDVDRSGHVDIADVLALARDDASITQEDLDTFAQRLVNLSDAGDAS